MFRFDKARAYDRILKVSRTIADLVGEENILQEHIAEAIEAPRNRVAENLQRKECILF